MALADDDVVAYFELMVLNLSNTCVHFCTLYV